MLFCRCFPEASVFSYLNSTRPDNNVIDENNRNVLTLEVGCCFDSCVEEAYSTKLVKYHPCTTNIWPWLQMSISGFTKARAKQLAKYCSMSSSPGSDHTWRRRCLWCVSIKICCLNRHQTHIRIMPEQCFVSFMSFCTCIMNCRLK